MLKGSWIGLFQYHFALIFHLCSHQPFGFLKQCFSIDDQHFHLYFNDKVALTDRRTGKKKWKQIITPRKKTTQNWTTNVCYFWFGFWFPKAFGRCNVFCIFFWIRHSGSAPWEVFCHLWHIPSTAARYVNCAWKVFCWQDTVNGGRGDNKVFLLMIET